MNVDYFPWTDNLNVAKVSMWNPLLTKPRKSLLQTFVRRDWLRVFLKKSWLLWLVSTGPTQAKLSALLPTRRLVLLVQLLTLLGATLSSCSRPEK